MDFTLKKYEELLNSLSQNNVSVHGVYDWFKKKSSKVVLIRHDVDRKAFNSLKVAQLEHKYKIKTTYYFRYTKGSFVPKIIEKIADLGHEIGYHYEDFALADGNIEKAKALFVKNLKNLRKYSEIKTIAMHGRPMSKHDSRDMWKTLSVNDFGIEAEAFLDIDYSDVFYFTDTGRTWSNKGVNIRDKVVSDRIAEIKNTDELISFIIENKNKKISIVLHPERWSDGLLEHSIIASKDLMMNTIKRILLMIR